jgi:hypothetical protein
LGEPAAEAAGAAAGEAPPLLAAAASRFLRMISAKPPPYARSKTKIKSATLPGHEVANKRLPFHRQRQLLLPSWH